MQTDVSCGAQNLTRKQVEYIEQDAVFTTLATQEDAPWGLARLSNAESGSTTYTYDDTAGAGTCAFVLDTGVEIDHPVGALESPPRFTALLTGAFTGI